MDIGSDMFRCAFIRDEYVMARYTQRGNYLAIFMQLKYYNERATPPFRFRSAVEWCENKCRLFQKRTQEDRCFD